MQKLDYYKLYFYPSELDEGNKYNELRNGKLCSVFKDDIDNPQNIDSIFFSPPYNNGYTSYMKIPVSNRIGGML